MPSMIPEHRPTPHIIPHPPPAPCTGPGIEERDSDVLRCNMGVGLGAFWVQAQPEEGVEEDVQASLAGDGAKG